MVFGSQGGLRSSVHPVVTRIETTIEPHLQVLFKHGETVEVRCVGDWIINGFYRDLNKLARDANTLNTDFNPQQNVYVCLNPVLPDLYAQRPEQFGRTERGGAVKDHQVVCRRWLLVDIDPVRPSGVSATDKQKQAAEEVATQVYAWLADLLGRECLVCADSGNGSHILMRLDDLPADDQTRWVCEQFLLLLSDHFSTQHAQVDKSTYNAARITTCYGTVKRKGSDLPEQPHRRSKLVLVPENLLTADWETLVSLVKPYPDKVTSHAVNGKRILDIPLLLEQQGFTYHRDDNYQTNSGKIATRFVLDVCPFNPDHNDRSAAITQWPSNGATAFKCHHNGCAGRDWSALRQLWQIPTKGGDVSESDIILPCSETSSTSFDSFDSYIEPPKAGHTAFYGPLGRIALGLEDRTEASPISILCSTLAYFGNAMGGKFFVLLDQPHFPKLYLALVGTTASGRKGTADSQARRIVDAINPLWQDFRHSGLSTGEGMLEVLQSNSEGIIPRPAIFTEREFAAVLKRAERRGNTLNTYIRDAWDNEPLCNSIKSEPIRIDDHHIGILAHITPAELKRLLTNNDVSNGFSNRFIWIHSQRTARRPTATGFLAADFQSELKQLQDSIAKLERSYIETGQESTKVSLDKAASQLWREQLYFQLDIDSDDDTVLTLMCSRQAQQVCRLALCFALSDGLPEISVAHLQAASAIVDYCRDTVDYMLSRDWWGEEGNSQDPAGMAPRVLEALQDRGAMTRTEISNQVFQRNRTAGELNALRNLMTKTGRLVVEKTGRTETWRLP